MQPATGEACCARFRHVMGLPPKPSVADEGALPVGTPMPRTSIAQFLALNPRLSAIKANRDTKGWEKRAASVNMLPRRLAWLGLG